MRELRKCFIFHIEQYNDDDLNDHYDIMNILLVNTIRKFYDEPIYAFNLKNVEIQQHILDEFEKLNVTLIEDPIIDDDGSDQYFLRNYVMSYAIEHNYLERYSHLIYLDIDVVVLGIIPEHYFDGIIYEPIPYYVLDQEAPYLPKNFESPLYYNWFQIISNTNKHLFKHTSRISRIDKYSDNDVSYAINRTDILTVKNEESFVPMKPPTSSSALLHYDSFKAEGSLIFLEKANPEMYQFIKQILDKYNVKFSKETGFWKHFITEYMRGRKARKALK